jgi:hypothetical protein
MRIRDYRNQVPGLDRPHSRAAVRYAVLAWLTVLMLFWLCQPGGVPVVALFSLVLGVVTVVHLSWVSMRRRRLVRQALAEAALREQRLAAALSRGPYQPSPPPAADPDAKRRRDLLDMVDKHGGLSPEARAAAAEITRHRTI